jgi:hypothetical protein
MDPGAEIKKSEIQNFIVYLVETPSRPGAIRGVGSHVV